MNKKTAFLALLFAIALFFAMAGGVTLFEDGSFALGQFPYPFSGCLPWGMCAN